jgi:hypothetical protein
MYELIANIAKLDQRLGRETGGRDDTERSQIGIEIAIDLTDDSSVPSHFVAACRPGSEFVEGWLELFCWSPDTMLRVVSQLPAVMNSP